MTDMSEGKTVAQKPFEIQMQGYEVVEKVAKPCATSARIIVPRDWIGKRVRVRRCQDLRNNEDSANRKQSLIKRTTGEQSAT